LVARLSRHQNLKHLRVSWAYEEAAEEELSTGILNHEWRSTVTKLELLTPLVPKAISVNYISKFYPSLKELSCKYRCLLTVLYFFFLLKDAMLTIFNRDNVRRRRLERAP
jgi:hypothetical protein